jgi:hypothetical protein
LPRPVIGKAIQNSFQKEMKDLKIRFGLGNIDKKTYNSSSDCEGIKKRILKN